MLGLKPAQGDLPGSDRNRYDARHRQRQPGRKRVLIRKAMRSRGGHGAGATTPWAGNTEDDAAGSLWALQHLTHLARQVLDLLEPSQRLLVVLLRARSSS